ncbi:MBOAT family protein [Lachnospiraceae bacterium ASD3451]|uniref:MBOAT family O-acyltransferase n=1 Tax=Diplocloster agilis TaxID=2850323 RepID=UPI001D1F3BBE|nr:MBOAT family O-acyltransferase [Diplocloster agilis]MBU9746721.1 MBOAT family protein [Diplocloster agilis]
MVFASYEFVFVFLPVVAAVYFLLGKISTIRIQHLFLVLASLFFYGYFNVSYLWIILSSIVVNYGIAVSMQRVERMRLPLFVLGILVNVGLLGYFKYYDFFVENINAVFRTDYALKHILLPLGISFFTFQQLSFLVSVYKKEEQIGHFIDYCLFVTFFPQLVAGPIVLYKEMMPQFQEEKRRHMNYENMATGFGIFALGMFKKAVLADTLNVFVGNGFGSPAGLGFLPAWLTALSYTLQIYFDFSGYSDMAVGIGRMFNIHLPVNFNSPYKSASVTEFWKRWHITLGRALSTYVYIPLGGNRKGLPRTCINLMLVFLVSGLWHGAAWTFVIWGALHGLVSVFERIFHKQLDKLPRILRVTGTFLFVNGAWVLFRADSLSGALALLREMFLPASFNLAGVSKIAADGIINFPMAANLLLVAGMVLILLFIVFRSRNTLEIMKRFSYNRKYMALIAVAFCIAVIHLSRESVFIYFNF